MRTPGWQFIEELSQLDLGQLRLPCIGCQAQLRRGSSKGITQDSVVDTAARLSLEVESPALARYPNGVLSTEEFIPGRDLTIPFVENLASENGGFLAPVEYLIDPARRGRYAIYEYALKTEHTAAR